MAPLASVTGDRKPVTCYGRSLEDILDSLPEEKQRILKDYDNKRFEEREKALKRPRLDAFRI